MFVSQNSLEDVNKVELPMNFHLMSFDILLNIYYGRIISDELKEMIATAFRMKFSLKRIAFISPGYTDLGLNESIYELVLSNMRWLENFLSEFACDLEHTYIDLIDDTLTGTLQNIIDKRASRESVPPMKTLILKNTSSRSPENVRIKMKTDKFIVDIAPNLIRNIKMWLKYIDAVVHLVVYCMACTYEEIRIANQIFLNRAPTTEIYLPNAQTFASIILFLEKTVSAFGIGPVLYFKYDYDIHKRLPLLTELVLRKEWNEYFTDIAKFNKLSEIFAKNPMVLTLKIIVQKSEVDEMDGILSALQLDPAKMKRENHWEGIYELDYFSYEIATQ